MRVGSDPETLNNLEKQHELVDTQIRSTDGIDYAKVRLEAEDLISRRKQGTPTSELRRFGRSSYPYFANKFPHFFQAIVQDCEIHRLDEFSKVMHTLLDGLERVQAGNLSQSELRKGLFETQLANRYLRPK